MDGQGFDFWIRSLGKAKSRRTLFCTTIKGAVAAAIAAAGLGSLALEDVEAAKCQKQCRQKFKRKKKRANTSKQRRGARKFRKRCLRKCKKGGTTAQRCAFDAQCATGRICEGGRCANRTCGGPGQCGSSGRDCVAGTCTTQTCSAAAECPDSYVCADGLCTPVYGGCSGPRNQCGDGTVCNDDNACVVGGACTSDEDCGDFGTCGPTNTCEATECTVDTDCGLGTCVLELEVCVPSDTNCLLNACTTDDDCCGGTQCTLGLCLIV